jgi:RNA polymerase sigma-B factor
MRDATTTSAASATHQEAEARALEARPGDEDAARQVEAWFRTYDATGDPAIRERIILAHLGFAERLAARYRRSRGTSYEDLVQAARVGLVTAVNRYDPNRSNSFAVYAIVCITGELRRWLRDTSWPVHVARTLKERALQVAQARETLAAALQRPPTVAEIAAHLDISQQRVREAFEAMRTRFQCSLDQPVDGDGSVSVGALLPASTRDVELDDLIALPGLIGSLPDVERRAVILRVYGDLKQDEIGDVLGYSQIHVSRLLRRALARMREQLLA